MDGEKRERENEQARGVVEVIRRVIAQIAERRSIPRAFNSPSSSCSLKIDRLLCFSSFPSKKTFVGVVLSDGDSEQVHGDVRDGHGVHVGETRVPRGAGGRGGTHYPEFFSRNYRQVPVFVTVLQKCQIMSPAS